MKAFVFAAGLGTRLKPLTDTCPKALLEVAGRPMLVHAVDKLYHRGVRRIIINVHHHAEQMKAFIANLSAGSGKTRPGLELHISDESDLLLDTGGGLKKASEMLRGEGPFFAWNADVISDIDLTAMMEYHRKFKPIATLAVTNRQGSRYFLWENNRLAGWENIQQRKKLICYGDPSRPLDSLAFSGIHIIEPDLLDLITEQGVFSIKDVYLRLAAEKTIRYFEHSAEGWIDIGTPEKLSVAKPKP